MPCANSWDGKWSGDGRLYAKTRYLDNTKADRELAAKILDKSPYNYRWLDGWVAQIDVKKVSAAEAAGIRKKSKGFYGYDWMIDSIMEHQEIKGRRA